MRHTLILILVGVFFTCPAFGRDWGHDLYGYDGRFMPYNTLPYFYVSNFDELADTVHESGIEKYDVLLKTTVNNAEKAFRQEAPERSTKALLDTFKNAKREHIGDLVKPLLGKSVSMNLEIKDVIKVKFNGDLPQYLIVGEHLWKSPTLISDDARRAVGRLSIEFANEMRALNKTTMGIEGKRTGLNELRKVKASGTEFIRNISEERVPKHVVFFLTDDESVAEWRVGAKKHLVGIIHAIGADTHDPGILYYSKRFTSGYIRIEVSLKLLDYKSPQVVLREEIPVAKKADSAYKIANNYYESKHLDLARKSFEKIVKDYPGTEAAQKAQSRLERINASNLIRGLD